jgi:transposase-like protein
MALPSRLLGGVVATRVFSNYPEAVRRLIYTTNPIGSLNSRVRKTVKGKSVFPTEIALFKALYLCLGLSLTETFFARATRTQATRRAPQADKSFIFDIGKIVYIHY